MKILKNPFRHHGIDPGTHQSALAEMPMPSIDQDRPIALLKRCPHAGITPLVHSEALATQAGVAALYIKDERARMGLGSFKALGAAYVIACDAEKGTAKGQTYVTASAGNHGLSVAAGASAFGAQSVVYISETVPEAFAERLRSIGAEVVRHGAIYEDSMAGAAKAAQDHGWTLLSDSSWEGYSERPHRLMEGYLVLMAEAIDQMAEAPTHIFLQAGVGGLAVASAALARKAWGNAPFISIVEPEAAPALFGSIEAGKPIVGSGPVSIMGRLDCKEPSLIALKGLARDADAFITLSEEESSQGDLACTAAGLSSTPSGTAGIAALLASGDYRQELNLDDNASVLTIMSEGPEA